MTIDAIIAAVSGHLVNSLAVVVAVAANKSTRAGQIWSLIATAGTAGAGDMVGDTVAAGDTEMVATDDVIITVSPYSSLEQG